MFPSAYRLRSEKDIKTLFARSKSVFDVYGAMKFRPNGLTHSRFTIVVGVRVSKLAVDRNRIKRRIREIVQRLHPHIRGGFDVVFLPKNTVLSADHPRLSASITQLVKRASLYV